MYSGKSVPDVPCCSGRFGAGRPPLNAGHAAPQATGVDAATVIAAESVTLTPLYAVTVVALVMPVPEIIHPTQGGVVGVAVSVNNVAEPDVDPTPELDDVNAQALPKTVRSSTGPFPKSLMVFGAINCGCYVTVCASAATGSNAARATANARIAFKR